MDKNQGTGFLERLIYVGVLALAMKAVGKGWIDTDMAIYIAVTMQGVPSLAYSWWANRPKKLLEDAKGANTPSAMLTAASEVIPTNAELVITTTPNASASEKRAVYDMAERASNKVVSKLTG